MQQAINPRELFLQSTGGRPRLELFTRRAGPGEHHFYARGIAPGEFATIFGKAIRPLQALVYRMPAGLLNPNYWEPLTRESENEVREKTMGVVTRAEGDRTLLWRADRIAAGRLLRDGLDVPVDLRGGFAFQSDGPGLLRLLQAWDGRDRFEWAVLSGLPKEGPSIAALSHVQIDLAQLRISMTDEAFLFSSREDGEARVVFAHAEDQVRAIEALLRGFAHAVTRTHVGSISAAVCRQVARVADGVGLSATAQDVIDTGRIIEIHALLGRTPWGTTLQPGEDPPLDGSRALIYYDRTSGIWAVST